MTKLRLVRVTSLLVAVPISVAISASVPVTWRGGWLARRGSRPSAVVRVRRRCGLAHAAARRTAGAGMRDRGAVRRHLTGPAGRVDQVAEGYGSLAGVGVLVSVAQSVGGAVSDGGHDPMAGTRRSRPGHALVPVGRGERGVGELLQAGRQASGVRGGDAAAEDGDCRRTRRRGDPGAEQRGDRSWAPRAPPTGRPRPARYSAVYGQCLSPSGD